MKCGAQRIAPGEWWGEQAGSARSAEDDRDRAVVDELDLHSLAESTGRDRNPSRREGCTEALTQRSRDLGTGGAREAGPVALRRVGKERELTDDERLASDVDNREVELSLARLEDPQPRNLPGQTVGIVRAVLHGHPEENEQARADGADDAAADRDAGTTDPLNDCAHRRSFSI